MKNIIISAFICLTFAISGCSSIAESTYGSSPSALQDREKSAIATSDKAKKEARKLKRDVRKAEKNLRKLERKLKRASKRKDKAKQVAKLTKEIKTAKKEIKSLKKDANRAELKSNRAKDRAKRLRLRYAKAVELEEKRKAEAENKKSSLKEDSRFATSTGSLFSDPTQKYITDYSAKNDGGFALPSIPVEKINKKFLRQEVRYFSKYKPGTLVVNTRERHLYLIQSSGKAIRYGIGVGKAGFEWEGEASIAWKKAWPTWTPPAEMIERSPKLAKYSAENGGQPAGLKNPLGARALYIFKDGKDTLFRVHGTPVWSSIGTAASSGCIRMMNQDVIDLYSRVRNGAKIVVTH